MRQQHPPERRRRVEDRRHAARQRALGPDDQGERNNIVQDAHAEMRPQRRRIAAHRQPEQRDRRP
jgi:hypothetical protein